MRDYSQQSVEKCSSDFWKEFSTNTEMYDGQVWSDICLNFQFTPLCLSNKSGTLHWFPLLYDDLADNMTIKALFDKSRKYFFFLEKCDIAGDSILGQGLVCSILANCTTSASAALLLHKNIFLVRHFPGLHHHQLE